MRASSSEPNRSGSISAIGRAPIEKMSRMMPPTPVAAPSYGSTADGWLWLSMRTATASPSPMSTTPAPSPGPDEHPRRLGREAAEVRARRLVGAVLRPHHRVHRELEVGRLPAELVDHRGQLVVGHAELAVQRLVPSRPRLVTGRVSHSPCTKGRYRASVRRLAAPQFAKMRRRRYSGKCRSPHFARWSIGNKDQEASDVGHAQGGARRGPQPRRIVGRYLDALEANKPKRGRKRTAGLREEAARDRRGRAQGRRRAQAAAA